MWREEEPQRFGADNRSGIAAATTEGSLNCACGSGVLYGTACGRWEWALQRAQAHLGPRGTRLLNLGATERGRADLRLGRRRIFRCAAKRAVDRRTGRARALAEDAAQLQACPARCRARAPGRVAPEVLRARRRRALRNSHGLWIVPPIGCHALRLVHDLPGDPAVSAQATACCPRSARALTAQRHAEAARSLTRCVS